jgi:hypothetical protein
MLTHMKGCELKVKRNHHVKEKGATTTKNKRKKSTSVVSMKSTPHVNALTGGSGGLPLGHFFQSEYNKRPNRDEMECKDEDKRPNRKSTGVVNIQSLFQKQKQATTTTVEVVRSGGMGKPSPWTHCVQFERKDEVTPAPAPRPEHVTDRSWQLTKCCGFQSDISVKVNGSKRTMSVKELSGWTWECKGWYIQKDRDTEGHTHQRVRADGCAGATAKRERTTCQACAGVGKLRSYRDAVRRCFENQLEEHGVGVRRRLGWRSEHGRKREVVVLRKRLVRALARCASLSGVMQTRTQRVYLSEAAARGDVTTVAVRLSNIAKQGLFKHRDQTTLDFVSDILRNLQRAPCGRRYTDKTRAVTGVIRAIGGGKM